MIAVQIIKVIKEMFVSKTMQIIAQGYFELAKAKISK